MTIHQQQTSSGGGIMMFDASDMHVDVYDYKNGMYLVKLLFPKMGMYWSGWTVRSSSRSRNGLWVQSPAHPVSNGRGWRKDAEFSGTSPFFDFIEEAVFRAIDAYNGEQDTVIEDIPDEPIGLDDIPDF